MPLQVSIISICSKGTFANALALAAIKQTIKHPFFIRRKLTWQ